MAPRPHLLDLANALTLQLGRGPTSGGVLTAITASASEHYKTLLSILIPDTFIEGVDIIPATSSKDVAIVRLLGPALRQYSRHEVTYIFGVDIFVTLNKTDDDNIYREVFMRELVMQTVLSIPIFGYTGTLEYGKSYGCATLDFDPITSDLSAEDAKLEGVSFGQNSVNSALRSFKISTSYILENQSWQIWI